MDCRRLAHLWERLDSLRGRMEWAERLPAGDIDELVRELSGEARELSAAVRALEDEQLERLIGCAA